MNRQDLRNRNPMFDCGRGVGYAPAKQGETLGSVLVGIFMWGTIFAAGVGTALPILKWLSHLT